MDRLLSIIILETRDLCVSGFFLPLTCTFCFATAVKWAQYLAVCACFPVGWPGKIIMKFYEMLSCFLWECGLGVPCLRSKCFGQSSSGDLNNVRCTVLKNLNNSPNDRTEQCTHEKPDQEDGFLSPPMFQSAWQIMLHYWGCNDCSLDIMASWCAFM